MLRTASLLPTLDLRAPGRSLTGQQVGEYVIGELIGVGGMGKVYEATVPEIGKRVAIKVLAADRVDEDSLRRFRAEAQAVNSISHRNIVDVFSFGELPDGSQAATAPGLPVLGPDPTRARRSRWWPSARCSPRAAEPAPARTASSARAPAPAAAAPARRRSEAWRAAQRRGGLHGKTFEMLEFRSMVVDAEARLASLAAKNEQNGPVFKMEHDPRVTAVGRFIRKYSIDQLPQLFNVLFGDMGIVGPRPPLPAEVSRYDTWHLRRLPVRPGLTCIWQVSGRNQITFEQWMRMDLDYIDNWSLWRDLHLVLKTVPAVLRGRGAS